MKRFFNNFFGTALSKKQIQDIPVLGIQPHVIQQKKFILTKKDIVVDLPCPQQPVLFWCDHHLTSEPTGELPENYHWKITPSCAGYLVDLALEKGASSNRELLDFKRVIDIMDSAEYTRKELKACFYKQNNYRHLSPLQKMHMIGAMFNTRDGILNDEIFKTLLASEMAETPLSSKALWQLNPLMYHKAQLEGFEWWRDNVDTYLRYNRESRCVIQDDRKAKMNIGNFDRFYFCTKYPQTSYNLSIRITPDKKARLGLGSNIFNKERCLVDIGSLCEELGKRFGGSGGGHYYVGGAVIGVEKCDEAIEFILEKFKEQKLES
ncbi:MAG: hypothetical protein AABW53_01270 [Nanoarchaeota archaeon]